MLDPEARVGRFEEAREHEVVLVGAGLAAASAVVLFVALFVPWYRHAAFCDFPACPVVYSSSGWTSLRASSALIAAAALAGVLPAIALAWRRQAWTLCLLATAAGLGAALLVLFRIAVPPADIGVLAAERSAGPFIALLGALGLAGGSTLAGLGSRFFEPARHAMPVLTALSGACIAIVVSLFLPWAREASFLPTRGMTATQTAWQRSSTLAVLLLLGSLAVMCACVLVSLIRWRSSFFALAGGGWLLAAIAIVRDPAGERSANPRAGAREARGLRARLLPVPRRCGRDHPGRPVRRGKR